jgi:NAD-dependent dihydropyrimidine dehydrogenase PreA subunit
MAVLVNFKICDNAKECGGIEVCPTGALSWDEENETIKIETTNKALVKDIKKMFAKKINIDLNKYKIRLLFKGLELLDDNLLCYNDVDNLSKIHVMVNPI